MGLLDTIIMVIISILLSFAYMFYEKTKLLKDNNKEDGKELQYTRDYEDIYQRVSGIVNERDIFDLDKKMKQLVITISVIFALATIILYFLSNYISKMPSILTYISVGLIVLIVIGLIALVKYILSVQNEMDEKFRGIVYYEYENILNSNAGANEKQLENIKTAYKNSEFDSKITNIEADQYIQANLNGVMFLISNVKVFKNNTYTFYRTKDNDVETSNCLFVCAASSKKQDLDLRGTIELYDSKKARTEKLAESELDRKFHELYRNVSNRPVNISSTIENILLELFNKYGILLNVKVKGEMVYIKVNSKKIFKPAYVGESISKEQLWYRYDIMRLLQNLVFEL